MAWWDSYRAVYGAELRAAAREFSDHGWPVVAGSGVLLVTGRTLDVLEVPASCGRAICSRLRADGRVVPVAATPTGSWWFPVTPGGSLPAELAAPGGVVLHTDGAVVLAPPSEDADGFVHWRVAPASTGYRLPPALTIMEAAAEAVRQAGRNPVPGAQRPVAVGV